MKLLVSLFLSLFIMSQAHANILSDEERKTAYTHSVITGSLNQCQAALSFLHGQFAYALDIQIIMMKKPDPDIVMIINKLKADFETIEAKMPVVRKFFSDNGLSESNIMQNEAMMFAMWKNRYRDEIQKLPRQKRGQYVDVIFGFVNQCVDKADWLIESFIK